MSTSLVVGLPAAPTSPLLTAVADLARRFDASVDLVHVIELPTLVTLPSAPMAVGEVPVLHEEVRLDDEQADLRRRLLREPALEGVRWTAHVLQGNAAQALLDRAEQLDAYAVVVTAAAHGFGAALDHALTGSTARDVLRHARRPVVVLPR